LQRILKSKNIVFTSVKLLIRKITQIYYDKMLANKESPMLKMQGLF